MKRLLIALLLPFLLSGCVKKPGEGYLEECIKEIAFRGRKKAGIGFGETIEAKEAAGHFSQWFKMLWDETASDLLKFDRDEPKTFCRVNSDVVVFVSYVPDAYIFRPENAERMCQVAWSAVRGVHARKWLPRCSKIYVVLRAPGSYGPLISGQAEDETPVLNRDKDAINEVYPFFAKKD